MHLFLVLCVWFVPSVVAQDVYTILDSINTIRLQTINLTSQIAAFDGKNVSAVVPITQAQTNLISVIQKATKAAEPVAPWDDATDLLVGPKIQSLADAVNASIATLVSRKPQFSMLGLDSVVVLDLQQLLNVSEVFSNEVLTKGPVNEQPIGQDLSDQVILSLQQE